MVGQGPTALAEGAGGVCLDIFSLVYHFALLSPSLWETVRCRMKRKKDIKQTRGFNRPGKNDVLILVTVVGWLFWVWLIVLG